MTGIFMHKALQILRESLHRISLELHPGLSGWAIVVWAGVNCAA